MEWFFIIIKIIVYNTNVQRRRCTTIEFILGGTRVRLFLWYNLTMNIKILNNSNWNFTGEDVIFLETSAKRDEFITKHIFNGGDWKIDFIKKSMDGECDLLTIDLTIKKEIIKDFNINSKIMWVEYDDNDIKYFYNVEMVYDSTIQSIKIHGDLNMFLTFPIGELFDNKNVYVERAMPKTFQLFANDIIPLNPLKNFLYNDELSVSIEDFKLNKIEKIKVSSFIGSLVNDAITDMSMSLYFYVPKIENDFKTKIVIINKVPLNVSCAFSILFNKKVNGKTLKRVRFTPNDNAIDNTKDTNVLISNSSDGMKEFSNMADIIASRVDGSDYILPYIPPWIYTKVETNDLINNETELLFIDTNEYVSNIATSTTTNHLGFINLLDKNNNQDNDFNNIEFTFDIEQPKYNSNVASDFVISNEWKLHFHFEYNRQMIIMGNEKQLHNHFLGTKNLSRIELTGYNAIDLMNPSFNVTNKNMRSIDYQINANDNYTMRVPLTTKMTMTSTNMNDYLTQNALQLNAKNQEQKFNFINKVANSVGGGILGGTMTGGGVGGAIGAIGGAISGIASSVLSNNTYKASLNDMKQDSNVHGVGNIMNMLGNYPNNKLRHENWKLNEYKEREIALFYYLHGYIINDILKINDILDIHYYFDIIKIPNVNNVLKGNNKTGAIKDSIVQMFANGLRLWKFNDNFEWVQYKNNVQKDLLIQAKTIK